MTLALACDLDAGQHRQRQFVFVFMASLHPVCFANASSLLNFALALLASLVQEQPKDFKIGKINIQH